LMPILPAQQRTKTFHLCTLILFLTYYKRLMLFQYRHKDQAHNSSHNFLQRILLPGLFSGTSLASE
jgi:hypothetical protein